MLKVLQLAALAAGALAVPSNHEWYQANHPSGGPPSHDHGPPNGYGPPSNVQGPPNGYGPPSNVHGPPNGYGPPGNVHGPPNGYEPPSNSNNGGQSSSIAQASASQPSTSTYSSSATQELSSQSSASTYSASTTSAISATQWWNGPQSHVSVASNNNGAPLPQSDAETPTPAAPSSGMQFHTVAHAAPTSTVMDAHPNSPTAALSSHGKISNQQQVGDSLLGTLSAPLLQKWIGDYAEAPWGDLTTKNSDATVQGDIPVTNVTRSYDWTISRGRIVADGVLRDVILINNQFPGPMVEANWGDWIEVKVTNNITDPPEGTSIHWHGQIQRGHPWEDGVPSVGQCPIAPGESFTSKYQAQLHGTSWYHAHYSAQFTAGVAGPLIVHGPHSMDYDIDLGPVMLSDWYHIPYFALVDDAVGTNLSMIPPTSDSNLINGRGRFNCSDPSYDSSDRWLSSGLESNIVWTCIDDAPLSKFRFQSGKTHLLRLVNYGANGVQRFSVDHHNLTVIATDYVPNVPYMTDVVTLGVGQRSDVLITALDTPKASIWMRSSASGGEPCGGSNYPEVKAAIYYEDANTSLEPTSTSSASYNSSACLNDVLTLTTPDYAITPSKDSWTQDLSLVLALNSTDHFEFRVNNQSYHADYNTPLLRNVQEGNFTFEPQWNVYTFGPKQSSTSIILNITNNMPLTHPFHLHGHNFYVLDFGSGDGPLTATEAAPGGGPAFPAGATWDGTVVNPENPMRRDTLLVPPYGYAALQFEMDNPGVWPFHCHIAWHLSGGQQISILYKPDEIPQLPDGFIDATCKGWDAFSATHRVDQIDAGA